MKRYAFLIAWMFIFIASCTKDKPEKNDEVETGNGPTDSLKMNQIQIIASHNSYHLKPDDTIVGFLNSLAAIGLLPAQYNPTGIDYEHLPFSLQFDNYNVRGLEIDFYNDPVGGQFYYRRGLSLLSLSPDSHIDELNQPGFKVLHIPDFDYNTNYYTFKSAMTAIYNWSLSHPNHLPIFINIETKDETAASGFPGAGLTEAIPFDADACDKIDEEIKSVFGENLDKVITPDDVRGSYSTLEEAVLAGNWPQLAKARGKVVFIMQGPAEDIYPVGHPSLQGRAMFVYSSPGEAEAAFVIKNNSSAISQIQQLVTQGYIVRTRADDGTTQAREGDYTDMNNAFESGAQIISTDYYKADSRAGTTGWTDYHVQFPNSELARINAFSAADKLTLGVIKE